MFHTLYCEADCRDIYVYVEQGVGRYYSHSTEIGGNVCIEVLL